LAVGGVGEITIKTKQNMKRTLSSLIALMVVLPSMVSSQVNWKALEVGGSGCKYSMKYAAQATMKVNNVVRLNEKPKPTLTEFEFRIVDELGKEKIGEVLFKKADINGMSSDNNRIIAELLAMPTYIKVDGDFFNAKAFEKEFEDDMIGAPIHLLLVLPLQSVLSVGLPPSNFKDGYAWHLTRSDTSSVKGEQVITVEDYAFNVSGFKDTLGYTCAIVNFNASSDILPASPDILAMVEEMDMVNKYNSSTKGRVLVDKTTGQLIALRIQKGYTLNAHMNDEEMDVETKEEIALAITENNLTGYTKNVRDKLSDYYHFNNTKITGSSLADKIRQNPNIDLLAAIEWNDIEANDERTFFWLKGNKASGAINIEGDTLVQFGNYIFSSWKEPDFFEDGYGVVKTAPKGYEILKRDGTKIPIDKKYYTVSPFHEGRAVVEIDDKFGDLYGLVDSTGKEVAAPFFSSIEAFSGGYARVTKDYKPGVIDINGKIIVPFNSHNLVSDMFYKSSFSRNTNMSAYGISVFNKDTKEYFILTPFTNGELKGPYEQVQRFENGYAKVRVNGKYGIIDSTCNYAIQPIYNFIWDKKNGNYLIQEKGLFGMLGSTGETMIPIEYEKIENTEDPSVFLVQRNGKKGAVSDDGKIILPIEHDYVSYLSGGMWRVVKQGFSGVINSAGEVVLPLEYNEISCYDSTIGLFTARKGDVAYLLGKVNKTVEELNEEQRYFFCGFQDSVKIWHNSEDKYGIRHLNGKDILPFEYDNIRPFKQFGFIVQKGEQMGIVDNRGNFVLSMQKIEIDEFKESKTITTFRSNGRQGLISARGEVLIEPIFDTIEIVKDDLLYVESNEKIGIVKLKN
jgi:WG containing repeat